MKILEVEYTNLVQYNKDQMNTLVKMLEAVLGSIPGNADIDFSNNKVVKSYFRPDSKEEYDVTVDLIVYFYYRMNRTYSDEYINVYRYIESSFEMIIEVHKKKKEFIKYKKNKNNISKLKLMYLFIEQQNIYHFALDEVEFLELIDNYVRAFRNQFVHNLHGNSEQYIIDNIINDGINVELKIQQDYLVFQSEIKRLYNIMDKYNQVIKNFVE